MIKELLVVAFIGCMIINTADLTSIISWDSYIDNLLAQTKDGHGTVHCDRACIIGIDGGAKWTTDGHANALKLQGSEGATIARCFKSGDFTAFMEDGILAEGVKYQFIRDEEVKDEKIVFGKKKGNGAITLQSSKTAIVIARTKVGSQQGNCNKGVSVIAGYLVSLGM